MRQDMKKVLTERPRFGHSRCYREVRARETRMDYDDLPTHQGISKPYIHYDRHKEFSDLLGPLIRFLWSCRGRRWDTVWSEICAQISNNTTGAHLKGHVMSEVDTHCVIRDDGKIYARSRYSGFREVDGLYVHPDTGLLCGDPPRRKARRAENDNVVVVQGAGYHKGEDGVLRPAWHNYRYANVQFSRKIIGKEKEAIYVDGFWFWVVFATVPPPSWLTDPIGKLPPRLVYQTCSDIVTGARVTEGRYRADKRQMNAVDLRRHGLVNHNSHDVA